MAWSIRNPQQGKRSDQRSEEANKYRAFYQSPEWRKLSRRVRDLEPLCRECAEHGNTSPATDSDHIKPLRTHWELRLDIDNVQPLCKDCHGRKTARGE